MTRFKMAAAGIVAGGLCLAAPAHADVTADQVWAAWKGVVTGTGQTVRGTEARSGRTLTVSDLTISAAMPDGGSSTVALGSIAFTEENDGSVTIAMAPAFPIMATGRSDEGEKVELNMTVRQPGLSLVASGVPQAIRYDFSAPEIGVTLDRLLVDGAAVDAVLDMVIAQGTGRYLVEKGAARQFFDSAFDADRMTLSVSGLNPDDGSRGAITAQIRDISSTSKGALPDAAANGELADMLRAGLDITGGLTHGGMEYRMNVVEAGDTTTIDTRSASGALDFALGEDGMTYAVASTDTAISISGPEIPLPTLDAALEEVEFRMQMPLLPTDKPADFALLTRLVGLNLSDQIWAMLDPAGQFPRDPATLVLDLAGKSRWTVDITDPTTDTGDAAPGELHALTVRDLRLSLAGAELTGAGDFSFDNSDTTTFDGMPRPEGSLALQLVGGNALLDKLVNMGLVPAEQATGFRMMLGLFARPGAGGDTLVSEITVTENGQVLANGQRLR
ncbi:DUF2125 domain-containing protein [Rhodovulum adriaticum]|uniref:Uncharacterized protein DUF2125 n=1 Tax=Rhodovulum adriaticum TaxID=35804 RepID=A0A4V2SMG6_RHOAD|nr:DUF2125 domain-containing protein [Rhodovulum adriaticum]MBK1634241.1 hypothetical protein [Rhodovulum adriaticum]TCP27206.1 uncharacterized protein DUF2125 [Rhodovulum adriaticum]